MQYKENKLNKTFLLIVMCVGLAACDKAVEKISEKAVQKMAEKAIESKLNKDGSTTKINIGDGTIKSTTTDANGKTTTSEFGSAAVTEADVGVPFYPGAIIKDGKGTKVISPDSAMIAVTLESKDDLEKVTEYYRSKLKAQSAGRKLMDMSQAGESAMFSLTDDKNDNNGVTVSLSKHSSDEKATDIMIMLNSSKAN